ncbi:unnamed protein product [Notodromas monacha]|uniref:RUN domain-containing protein n=1 Tax=Notodromas monacha TaxID=399045 RepID=A0A7R9BDK3_9CRUS|nr:unnamed protein product [Notodromas monacha]CAG0913420.1 unnamed protein product [Notodromas monacha]
MENSSSASGRVSSGAADLPVDPTVPARPTRGDPSSACHKSFHVGTAMSSLPAVVAAAASVINTGVRLAPSGRRCGGGPMAASLFALPAGGGGSGYAMTMGGFRRPDWLVGMAGSTLTDASSLSFEDNDYQWCSEYASSLHSPCGYGSVGNSGSFRPVGLLSLSTSGVVHDSSVPSTPDDLPRRKATATNPINQSVKCPVDDSMYACDEDGPHLTGAAVDFEVFPAEDIHGFMQFPEESVQSDVLGAGGETFASITQSLMAAQEWGLVDSDNRAIFQSSVGASSLCGSTPLFSPTREEEDEVSNVSIGVFSVDSLDVHDASSKCEQEDGTFLTAREEDLDDLDLELTWTTADIKTNYTLAFEGSYTTTTHEVSTPDGSQDGSRASTTGPSWTESLGKDSVKMTQSTATALTGAQYTWSQIKLLKCNTEGVNSNCGRSFSMPDLMRRSLNVLNDTRTAPIYKASSRNQVPSETLFRRRSLAQLFLRNRLLSSRLDGNRSTNENASLVDSITEEGEEALATQNGSGGSTNEEFCSAKSNLSSRSGARAPDIPTDPKLIRCGSNDSQSSTVNVSSLLLTETNESKKHSKGMQTSGSPTSSEATSVGLTQPFSEDSLKRGRERKRERASILVCYPNYALPDLTFLGQSSRKFDADVYLCPRKASGSFDNSVVDPSKLPQEVQKHVPPANAASNSEPRPLSTDDILRLQESSLSHIKDWDSLQTLLPDGVRRLIGKRGSVVEAKSVQKKEPSFEPEIKFRKPRPRSCDPALLLRKPFLLEQTELIHACHDRHSGSHEQACRNSGQVQPKSILRKTSSSCDDRSATSTSETITATSQSSVKRRTPPCSSPASRVLRNLRSRSAENQNKLSVAARRKKHRESYIYDDSAGENDEDESSAVLGPPSESSCACTISEEPRRPDALELRSHVSDMISARSSLAMPDLGARKRFHRSAGNLFDGKFSCAQIIDEMCAGKVGERQMTQCPCGGVLRHRKSVSFAELEDADVEQIAEDERDWCFDCRERIICAFLQRSALRNVSSTQFCSKDCGGCCADVPTLWSAGAAVSSASLPTTPLKCARAALSPTLDFNHKQDLVDNLASAVLELRKIVRQAVSINNREGEKSNDVCIGGALPSASPAERRISDWALDCLCPTIYAALSDGLLPQIQTLFGSVPNSLWKVVEVSSQLGSTTKALNDLVTKVNAEEHLNEGPLKFNAFICGLLNIQSLRSWLCYLRTRESVIQKHFHPHAFLYGANSWSRGLFDEMLSLLAPLSTQSFRFDLLYEYRRLHSSFQFMEEKMKHHMSADRLDAQDSAEDRRGAMRKAHSQDYFLDSGVGATQSDKPEADQHMRGMVRTRSSMDNTNTVTDFAAGVKKRWSGVQLGSKLLQALDQLALDDEDLEIPGPAPQIKDVDGSDKNGNKRSQESVKFSRLRRKWELLSGNKKPLSPLPSKIPRPVQKVSPTGAKPLPSASAAKKPEPPAKPAVMPKTFPVPLSGLRPKSAPQKATPAKKPEVEMHQLPVMTPESEQSCFSPMDTSSSSARSSSSAGSGVANAKANGRPFTRWTGPPTQSKGANKNWKPPLTIPPKPISVSETHRANPSGTLCGSPIRSKPKLSVDDNANGENSFSGMR